MKTRLILPEIKSNFGAELLKARGINNVQNFLNPTIADLNDWRLLDNCYAAAELLEKILQKETPLIGLIQDCDVDGLTSSAIIYQYIKLVNPKTKINVYIHEGKQHGLEDCWEEFEGIAYDLLIIPDAGRFAA